MKLLLHMCCAPCANRPVEALQAEGISVTGFWYNPNIHPFTEYRERRNTLRTHLKAVGIPLMEDDSYGLRPFVREVAEDITNRCEKCYAMRLRQTAKQAKEAGFDGFTTTLFISPYQNHELMKQVAARAAAQFDIPFIYRDFRPLFQEGQQFASTNAYYMQKYCGCIFSEQERYLQPHNIIP